MAGCAMAFGQRQYTLVFLMGGYPSLNSWHNTPPGYREQPLLPKISNKLWNNQSLIKLTYPNRAEAG